MKCLAVNPFPKVNTLHSVGRNLDIHTGQDVRFPFYQLIHSR